MPTNRTFPATLPPDPVSWPQERRLLFGRALRDGIDILDLGCGPGYVTAALARDLPMARLFSVDHDGEILRLAKALLAPAARRVHVVHADALALPIRPNRLDFVISRYVFQHLGDPDAAARQALRVLKPGGRLAIIDVDADAWGVSAPPFTALKPQPFESAQLQPPRSESAQLQAPPSESARLQPAASCDPATPLPAHSPHRMNGRFIARRLPRLLRAAGFADVSLDAFVYHSDDVGVAAFESQMTPPHYASFAAAPDPFVMMIGFLASGVKP